MYVCMYGGGVYVHLYVYPLCPIYTATPLPRVVCMPNPNPSSTQGGVYAAYERSKALAEAPARIRARIRVRVRVKFRFGFRVRVRVRVMINGRVSVKTVFNGHLK